MAEWRIRGSPLSLDRPRIMGILNVTPDSFWDGGRHQGVDQALAHSEAMLAAGADLIDVGGESTRPGAEPVPAEQELARVIPVVEALARRWPELLISVDTVKADVARSALTAGAAVVNDVGALRLDAETGSVVAESGAGVVLMHSRGQVDEMASYETARYGPDPVAEIARDLGEARDRALGAGVPAGAIVLDPGLGFSKRTEHSIAVLAHLDRIRALGHPVLVGPSRKRFVGEAAGGLAADERLEATIGACVAALFRGARIFRVHDVAAVHRALAVAEAIRAAP